MNHVPSWWAFALLALASFRLFRLIAFDVILRPMRVRVIRRAEVKGTVYVGEKLYRPTLDEFVHCPWCLGFWIVLGLWASWLVWPDATLVAAAPLAISAIVGLVAHNLD